MHSGPEVSGCKPVLVTFEEYRDRDEVLRKANTLKGSGLSVTEDMSRRVREARTELRKFMRDLKKSNPAATCHVQYDKLFVNHRCYVWSESQAKVVEFSQADQSRPSSRSSSPVKPRRLSGNNGNNNGSLSRAGSRQEPNIEIKTGSDISPSSASVSRPGTRTTRTRGSGNLRRRSGNRKS